MSNFSQKIQQHPKKSISAFEAHPPIISKKYLRYVLKLGRVRPATLWKLFFEGEIETKLELTYTDFLKIREFTFSQSQVIREKLN